MSVPGTRKARPAPAVTERAWPEMPTGRGRWATAPLTGTSSGRPPDQPHPRPPRGAGRRAAPASSGHRPGRRREGAAGGGGDALPRALAGRVERLARLQRAKAQLEAEAAARQQRYQQRAAELAAAARARGQRPEPTSGPAGAMRPQSQGDGQHHRPRQPVRAEQRPHPAGLQRPGGRHLRAGVVAAELTQQATTSSSWPRC